MVREATVFDLGQSTYNVTEGGTATITVLRSGNRAGADTVHYEATGGTAPLADYQAASGTLTFAPNAASATFTVKTNAEHARGRQSQRQPRPLRARPAWAPCWDHGHGVLNIVDEDKAGTVKLSQAGVPDPRGRQERGDRDPALWRSGVRRGRAVRDDGRHRGGRRGLHRHQRQRDVRRGRAQQDRAGPDPETAIVDGSRSFTFAITGATPPSTVIGTPASAPGHHRRQRRGRLGAVQAPHLRGRRGRHGADHGHPDRRRGRRRAGDLRHVRWQRDCSRRLHRRRRAS